MKYIEFVEMSKKLMIAHQSSESIFSREIESKEKLISEGYNGDINRFNHGISYVSLNEEIVRLGTVGFSLNESKVMLEHHQNLVYKSLLFELTEGFLAFIRSKFPGNAQKGIAKSLAVCNKKYDIINVNAGVFLIYLWQMRNAIGHNDLKFITYDEVIEKTSGNSEANSIRKFLLDNGKESWEKINQLYTNSSQEILITERALPKGGKTHTLFHIFNILFSCAKLINEATMTDDRSLGSQGNRHT